MFFCRFLCIKSLYLYLIYYVCMSFMDLLFVFVYLFNYIYYYIIYIHKNNNDTNNGIQI